MKLFTRLFFIICWTAINLATAKTATAQTSFTIAAQMSYFGDPCNGQVSCEVTGMTTGYPATDSLMTQPFKVMFLWGDGTKDSAFAYNYGSIAQGYFYAKTSHSYFAGANYSITIIAIAPDSKTQNANLNHTQMACKAISGKVYIDNNNNCAFDGGERPINNAGIKAISSIGENFYNKSAANGDYTLMVPDNGSTYTVKVNDVFGGSVSNVMPTCPPSGEYAISSLPATNKDFGFQKSVKALWPPYYAKSCNTYDWYYLYPHAAVIGYQPGENISLTLSFGDGKDTTFNQEVTTSFDSIYVGVEHQYAAFGNYTLKFLVIAPDGKRDSLVFDNAIVIKDTCARISGKAYIDINQNCIQDVGEEARQYVSIRLLDDVGNWIQSDNTNFDGTYSFTAPDKNKTYTVTINDPQGSSIKAGTPICPASGSYEISSFPAVDKDFAMKKEAIINYVSGYPKSSCAVPSNHQFYAGITCPGYTTGSIFDINVFWGDGKDSLFSKTLDTINMSLSFNLNHIYTNAGNMSVRIIVTDSQGAADTLDTYNMFNISDTCAAIMGRVFIDDNGDCVFNNGEKANQYSYVELTDNGSYVDGAYTYNDGHYYFSVSNNISGHNYKVKSYYDNQAFNSCVANNEYVITTLPAIDKDFGFSCKQGYDLSGFVSGWGFRPGFDIGRIDIVAKNRRCESVNGQVKFVKSPLITPYNVNPPADNIIGDTLIWNVPNMDQNKIFHAHLDVSTSAAAVLGDSIRCKLILEPLANDATPADNNVEYVFEIRNSWDPNMKTDVVNGVASRKATPVDTKEITYTVCFQNTGNDAAYNIFVMDTLDKNVDQSSIEVLSYSHPMKVDMLPGGIMKFNFNNIMLADSFSNEPASHGFVTYKATLKPGLSTGTSIKNTAHIYFDFNPAVITNTTENILTLTSGIAKGLVSLAINMFPNPANTDLTIVLPKEALGGQIEVFDIMGATVLKATAAGPLMKIKTAEFPIGLYLIQVSNGNAQYKSKVSVVH